MAGEMVSLWVYTDGRKHDDAVLAVVGRESYGSGFDFSTQERDLSFEFSVDEPTALGLTVLKLVKLPGVLKVEVHEAPEPVEGLADDGTPL